MTLKIESCVDEIVEVGREIGHPPSQTEYRMNKNTDAPNAQQIIDRIGSWEGDLIVAGMNPSNIESTNVHSRKRPSYNLEDIIEAIQFVTEQVDGEPSVTDYKDKRREDDPTITTIYNRFDDKDDVWDSVLETAGVRDSSSNRSQKYTDEDCLNAVKQVVSELDREPSQSDYKIIKDENHSSLSTVKERFNGWVPAVRKAKEES